MKRIAVVFAAVVACLQLGLAETVSYSVPVLTVQSDGQTVVPGSGKLQRCPFSFCETTNMSPVRVSIVEDVPSGAGNSTRASVWLAAMTAALTLHFVGTYPANANKNGGLRHCKSDVWRRRTVCLTRISWGRTPQIPIKYGVCLALKKS